ncbi:phosphosugar isomerase [Gymnodinialimonas sp. 2305UL16-5]|uniref:phosphosugar isomerase n=1 Tax=Gymnodinialimonas mytili TaxID=3126503 RepID=UPI0030B7481E
MTPLDQTATWAETHRQPEIWRAWAEPLAEKAAELSGWITSRGIEEVWLSGAGSSSFIGQIAAAEAQTGLRLIPASTTDIVSAPKPWIARKARILSIQFGRSGDSSESVGLLDILDAHRPDIDRLNITCNPNGALATRQGPGPGESRALVLPEATHDVGFAMTSSVTTMLLSALAVLGQIDASEALPKLADAAGPILAAPMLADRPRPDRAIFLGTGAMQFVARESALKVLELTAGKTMAIWDSSLGFRHGPKAAIEDGTQVYILLHPDPHSRAYDLDLAAELKQQFPDASVTTIGPGGDIAYGGTGQACVDAVLAVLPSQVLSARWSADLGLHVDDPFQGQGLSRVVAGVTLYPLP